MLCEDSRQRLNIMNIQSIKYYDDLSEIMTIEHQFKKIEKNKRKCSETRKKLRSIATTSSTVKRSRSVTFNDNIVLCLFEPTLSVSAISDAIKNVKTFQQLSWVNPFLRSNNNASNRSLKSILK